MIWSIGLIPWFIIIDIQPIIFLVLLFVPLIASRFHLLESELVVDFLIATALALFFASRFSSKPEGRLPMRAIAKAGSKLAAFSYSLYLVHMPIAQALTAALNGRLDPNKGHSYLEYAAALVFILFIASLFGAFFETHTNSVRIWIRSILVKPLG